MANTTLKLPFTLDRISSSSPVTTADCVDVTPITGVTGTTTQAVLEYLALHGGGSSDMWEEYD